MDRPAYLQQIEKRMMNAPAGDAFITSDFLDIADTQAVNKALSRLAEDRRIRRVLRGVYDRPRYSELLQEYTAPRMETVAKAIARNFGWTIAPCGDTALNMLGLSTQVPAVWLYVSDGPYREYDVGSMKLKFKHTTLKDIAGVSTRSALVVQALKALGNGNVNEKIIRRLSSMLTINEKKALLLETQRGTTWIYEIAREVCAKEDAGE